MLKGALNVSGLEEHLQQLLTPYSLASGHLPSSHADATCEPSSVITTTTRNGNPSLLCLRLNSSRESIEHELGLGPLLNKRLTQKHTWKLLMLGIRAKHHLFTSFLLLIAMLVLDTTKHH